MMQLSYKLFKFRISSFNCAILFVIISSIYLLSFVNKPYFELNLFYGPFVVLYITRSWVSFITHKLWPQIIEYG